MLKRLLLAVVPIALLLAAPLCLLTPETREQAGAGEVLTLLSPHSEAIAEEFTRAFAAHYRRQTGRSIRLEWLSVGGTSEIIRYIDERYTAAFRKLCESEGLPWNGEIAAAFKNPRLDKETASPAACAAREKFLASATSIDIDIFFGGGSYDQNRNAQFGYAVSANLREQAGEYFAQVPPEFSGEVLYDPQERYYGVCLSSFGICYSPERLREMNTPPPRCWADLAAPVYFRRLAAADPTKSGSINKCYEMILQQAMQEAADPDAGWNAGFNRLKCIIANARLITDSAGQVTRDVASGNAAAGMAIDFYALSEADWSAAQSGGASHIVYVPPEKGSAVTCDPVQLLRGAPNPEAAKAFIAFLLSPEGQKIWAYRTGAPGGPAKHRLCRQPILPALYGAAHRPYMIEADYNPYTAAAGFKYRPEYTARFFNLLRVLLKCIALDVLDEMQGAWGAVIAAGGPEKVPSAWAEFCKLPVSFADAPAAARRLYPGKDWSMAEVIALRREWTAAALKQYRRAKQLAVSGR